VLYPLALGTSIRAQSHRLGESPRLPSTLTPAAEADRTQDTEAAAA